MAGNAFDNINKLYLSDTFRAWFDKTNEVVAKVNPLEIYGVTADKEEHAGITFQLGTDGRVKLGLDLPNSLTGDFTFTGGVTFANTVRITGLTLDINDATVYGSIVRTINGATGDILLTHVNMPGTVVDGDILYYEATGSTFNSYRLFSDGSVSGNPLHIGAAGGVFMGVTSGGISSANFIESGSVQLLGATATAIFMTNNGTTNEAKTRGADIRYGTQDGTNSLVVMGRNDSGLRHTSENLVVDFDRQTLSVGGATGNGVINIHNPSGLNRPIIYTHAVGGATFGIRYLPASDAAGRSSGGFTGVPALGGGPDSKGLVNDDRVRLESTAGSVEIEITGSGKTSGFAVYGQEISGGPYGSLLKPTIVARRDGGVVIGGIAPSDGGLTGSNHGSLNIVSGKLLMGGVNGAVITKGLQVLSSNGATSAYIPHEPAQKLFSGTITKTQEATKGDSGTVTASSGARDSARITFTNDDDTAATGQFSITVNFPLVKLFGSPSNTDNAIIGVLVTIDGVETEANLSVEWKDLHAAGIQSASPTFTITGYADTAVSIVPIMTSRSGLDLTSNKEGFAYVTRGTYLATFNKIG